MHQMIETPKWLAERCREQQSATPYFGLGFEKSELPPDLHARLVDQVRRRAHRFQPAASREEIRSIERAIPPAVQLQDPAFDEEIRRALQARHEAWSEMKLTPSAGGGIRAFQRGSYVLHHVDRTSTRIISSILCVDHKLDAPWPLRIEDIDGRAHEVDLAPGELLFYEGARLLHGRPWPLRGDYCISMSVHYRPRGLGFS